MPRPRPGRSPFRTRPPRTSRLAVLAAVALLAAGCQDARQRRAEHAVERHLRAQGAGGYDLNRTHCTRVARLVAEQLETKVFLCLVPTQGARCDEFRATLLQGRFRVAATRRDVDCFQPMH